MKILLTLLVLSAIPILRMQYKSLIWQYRSFLGTFKKGFKVEEAVMYPPHRETDGLTTLQRYRKEKLRELFYEYSVFCFYLFISIIAAFQLITLTFYS